MITIVDYGMGNLGSIQNMLKKIGVESSMSSDVDKIEKASKIILPGVGSFDQAMINLERLDLVNILSRKALGEKIPFLGICLGMQLLANSSEEGIRSGLGWIDGKVLKFNLDSSFKVPHMGWNSVNLQWESQIFNNMYPDPRFYFVHSYYFDCNNKEDILTTSEYGINFVSAVKKDNILGVQFHPEKSHKFGMKLLENFSKI